MVILMKKFSIWKKLQLAILIMMSALGIFLALRDDLFYENMQDHPTALGVYIMMWLVLASGYLFLFLDFMFLSKIKNDYSNLNRVAYSDHLSGIPNRFSCDVLLDKYAEKAIPHTLGCMMLEITNLFEINSAMGHSQGNELIKDFSVILSNSALALCFVGRNGGNKFLAVFEEDGKEKAEVFIARLQEKVAEHNAEHRTRSILYKYGLALNENEQREHLTELISLANSRING